MFMQVDEAKKSEFNRAPPDFILSTDKFDPENGGMVMWEDEVKKVQKPTCGRFHPRGGAIFRKKI